MLLLPEVLPRLKRIKVYDRFDTVAERLVGDLQPLLPKVVPRPPTPPWRGREIFTRACSRGLGRILPL